MPYHEVEETLARALTYLRLSGITVTPEVARRALRLVDSALEEGEQRLLAQLLLLANLQVKRKNQQKDNLQRQEVGTPLKLKILKLKQRK
jgi:hypothetical protein